MKKTKTLLAALSVGILTAVAGYSQTSVLIISDGRAANVDFADWLQIEHPGYTIDLSDDVDPTLRQTTAANGINQTQMDLLNSYSLIIVPRLGPGVISSTIDSSDWNLVASPILNLHAQTTDVGNWGWINTHSGNIQNVTDLTVVDAGSPVFDGLSASAEDEITMFTSRAVRTAAMSEADFGLITGNIAATVTGPPTVGAPDEVRLGIVMWDGTEEAFYTGGVHAPGGVRTLFLGPTNSPDQTVWTPEGQEIFLNAMQATIPESSTYALLFGAAALGGVLLMRRFRRGLG